MKTISQMKAEARKNSKAEALRKARESFESVRLMYQAALESGELSEEEMRELSANMATSVTERMRQVASSYEEEMKMTSAVATVLLAGQVYARAMEILENDGTFEDIDNEENEEEIRKMLVEITGELALHVSESVTLLLSEIPDSETGPLAMVRDMINERRSERGKVDKIFHSRNQPESAFDAFRGRITEFIIQYCIDIVVDAAHTVINAAKVMNHVADMALPDKVKVFLEKALTEMHDKGEL